MEKLADGLQKLKEEDLLEVVSMIMEHKTVDTYTKNDVEREFFSFYTFLPQFSSPRSSLCYPSRFVCQSIRLSIH